ncbi:uroporphyrinogen-III synthase [Komagataeibacter melomenusus]|uniref:uroporphyrinogen-III synthase n=1 Tax=Komagataeibacter melomenusus TaxID=2766578 RepID=UPI001F509EBD|nr:uroporphyrinogen-III synthase [Komagataeibacter melomenusus]
MPRAPDQQNAPVAQNGVIITRPPPGLAPTMAAVAGLGWQPIAASMLHVEPLSLAPDTPRPDAIVLTSGQAIAAINRPAWHDVPCYVVGHATGARARVAGFTHVVTAAGTADDLAALLRAALPARGRLLLAVGRGYGRDMAQALRAEGFRVMRRCVYAVRPGQRLPMQAAQALGAGQVAAILFYSTRTAQAFLAALTATQAGLLGQVVAVAMSAGVANALATVPAWRDIRVAARPDQAAMLACLGNP